MDDETMDVPKESTIVEPARILITVLPDGNLDININGVSPVLIIGAAEILKGMGMGMIQAAQTSGLVVPQRGTLDHLRKGGMPS